LLLLDGHGSHVNVNFILTLKQYNLPPYSFYVLQHINLSSFLPLKSRYRAEIAELAALNNASSS
ncbi:hypothetical protein K432DRAFT_285830, partial [Lepidopterella palustris CBS 459.81]